MGRLHCGVWLLLLLTALLLAQPVAAAEDAATLMAAAGKGRAVAREGGDLGVI